MNLPENLTVTEIVVNGFAVWAKDKSFGGGWAVTSTTYPNESVQFEGPDLNSALQYVSGQVAKGVTG